MGASAPTTNQLNIYEYENFEITFAFRYYLRALLRSMFQRRLSVLARQW